MSLEEERRRIDSIDGELMEGLSKRKGYRIATGIFDPKECYLQTEGRQLYWKVLFEIQGQGLGGRLLKFDDMRNIRLLEDRLSTAGDIALYKMLSGTNIRDRDRENKILEKAEGYGLKDPYMHIISSSVERQERIIGRRLRYS
ncbi:MAG: chorismate mutase [Nanobdellota archaeon]